MYPEGSPAHPAYPSGHATVAGACTTVLKALFEDTIKMTAFLDKPTIPRTLVMPDPNDPTQLCAYGGPDASKMTIGSELDKLASNIALGRNFGGVHFRSDGDEGILLGERVAIRLLMDHARTYAEDGFQGFRFLDRTGRQVTVTADSVTRI